MRAFGSTVGTKQLPGNGGAKPPPQNVFDGNPLRGDSDADKIYGEYRDCVQLPLSFAEIPTAVFQNSVKLSNNAQTAYVGERDQGALTFTVEKGYVIRMKVTVGASSPQPLRPNYPPHPFRDSMSVTLEEGDSFLMAAGTGTLQLSIIRNQREYVNQGDLNSMVNAYNGQGFYAQAELTLLKKCVKLGESIPDTSDDDNAGVVDEGIFVFTDDQRFLLIGMVMLAFGSRYIIKRGS